MVDGLLRYLDPGRPGLCPRYLQCSDLVGWPGDGCLVLVLWQLHGHVHSCFGYVHGRRPGVSPPTDRCSDRTCVGMAVSELVSAYPTAGGMYFVTKQVVPERHVPMWSWIVGWCNFLGQAAGGALRSLHVRDGGVVGVWC